MFDEDNLDEVDRYIDYANTSFICSQFKGDSVRFFNKLVQFRLDASATGQNTINWFIVNLVNFCPTNLVIWVYFTERPSQDFSFDEEYALHDQVPVDVSIIAS